MSVVLVISHVKKPLQASFCIKVSFGLFSLLVLILVTVTYFNEPNIHLVFEKCEDTV
jgi:hypothetical protein